jgi:hypothetical protein
MRTDFLMTPTWTFTTYTSFLLTCRLLVDWFWLVYRGTIERRRLVHFLAAAHLHPPFFCFIWLSLIMKADAELLSDLLSPDSRLMLTRSSESTNAIEWIGHLAKYFAAKAKNKYGTLVVIKHNLTTIKPFKRTNLKDWLQLVSRWNSVDRV